MRGKRIIANLFTNGQTIIQDPYKVIWVKVPETGLFPSRFAVSVSKRLFKKAVNRNLIKRRTREVFRTNKQSLNSVITAGSQIHIMFIYTADAPLLTVNMEDAMKIILQNIAQQYAESV